MHSYDGLKRAPLGLTKYCPNIVFSVRERRFKAKQLLYASYYFQLARTKELNLEPLPLTCHQ